MNCLLTFSCLFTHFIFQIPPIIPWQQGSVSLFNAIAPIPSTKHMLGVHWIALESIKEVRASQLSLSQNEDSHHFKTEKYQPVEPVNQGSQVHLLWEEEVVAQAEFQAGRIAFSLILRDTNLSMPFPACLHHEPLIDSLSLSLSWNICLLV